MPGILLDSLTVQSLRIKRNKDLSIQKHNSTGCQNGDNPMIEAHVCGAIKLQRTLLRGDDNQF